MPTTDLVILYVDDPLENARFHAARLGRAPIESSPGFVMFALDHGLKLGLWARAGVTPPAADAQGELVLHVGRDAEVERMHADWIADGVAILAPPETREFGRSFVATDPDGHRLRVLAPAAEPGA